MRVFRCLLKSFQFFLPMVACRHFYVAYLFLFQLMDGVVQNDFAAASHTAIKHKYM